MLIAVDSLGCGGKLGLKRQLDSTAHSEWRWKQSHNNQALVPELSVIIHYLFLILTGVATVKTIYPSKHMSTDEIGDTVVARAGA